jgi:hypothetical protein
MIDDQLATRWRALHAGFMEYCRKLKKLLVSPKTWKLLIAVFRIVMWITRIVRQFM